MYACHTTNENPGVLMEPEEASHLALAVEDARQRVVAEIAKVGRSRSMSDSYKKARVELLRDHLAHLEAFAKALGKAHDLGGN